MKWHTIEDSKLRFSGLPGWFLCLRHNGEQTLAVWSNGRAFFTMPAAKA